MVMAWRHAHYMIIGGKLQIEIVFMQQDVSHGGMSIT
jgi:hypothetical protein